MLILNLNPGFTPFKNSVNIPVVDFPSGIEPHIKIPATNQNGDKISYNIADPVLITCRIQHMNDFFRLILCTDALKRMGFKDIEVFIPYLPFARQDRVMTPGEPLSLKVFSKLINNEGYSKVFIYDAHSELAGALIDNCFPINNHSFVQRVVDICNRSGNFSQDYYIINPDAGAYKKIFGVCQAIKYQNEIIMCNKLRDVSKKGVLHSVTVSHDDLNGRDCFIIDDICDGGGTFNLLADELKKRNCGNIYVIVSHGIFSKGLDVFPKISKIFTTDAFNTITLERHSKLIQIELGEIDLYPLSR